MAWHHHDVGGDVVLASPRVPLDVVVTSSIPESTRGYLVLYPAYSL